MNASTRDTRWLEFLFILLAFAGLAGTGAQLPAWLPLGLVAGTAQIWKDALAALASLFLLVDIFVLGTAVFAWMFGECRRLGIPAVWAWGYFIGSWLLAISFFMPMFMAHRLRRIRALHPDQQTSPAGSDLILLALALAAVVAAVAYSFGHIPT